MVFKNFFSLNSFGTIIIVPVGNSNQTAIDNANCGDTIQLEEGVYEEIHLTKSAGQFLYIFLDA